MSNSSYVAANSIPKKIYRNKELVSGLLNNHIIPIHIQFIPTNRCNLKCSFCSCSERDQKKEFNINEIDELIEVLTSVGCKSVTITGGGEPLLHPHINEIIEAFDLAKISIGLVTNGYLIKNLSVKNWYKIRWCRISGSDDRSCPVDWLPLREKIDWAFSYVVTDKFNAENLIGYLKYAEENEFTHVRVVSDILDTDIKMDEIKRGINALYKGDLSKVIFQNRTKFTHGMRKCYISLLKPNIDADGKIYPCCGSQYSEKEPSRKLSENMSLGHYKDLPQLVSSNKYFDGSKCAKCFYSDYNESLEAFFKPLNHEEFV